MKTGIKENLEKEIFEADIAHPLVYSPISRMNVIGCGIAGLLLFLFRRFPSKTVRLLEYAVQCNLKTFYHTGE